jgi:hypothetical protein
MAVAIARITETLVAIAAGEGPAPGVHNGVFHHVGLGLGHVAAITALHFQESTCEFKYMQSS